MLKLAFLGYPFLMSYLLIPRWALCQRQVAFFLPVVFAHAGCIDKECCGMIGGGSDGGSTARRGDVLLPFSICLCSPEWQPRFSDFRYFARLF